MTKNSNQGGSCLKTPFIGVALVGPKINTLQKKKKKSVSRKVAINLKHNIMHLWQLRSDTFEPLVQISQIF